MRIVIAIPLLIALGGCGISQGSTFEACLAGAKGSSIWINEPDANVREFRYLGTLTSLDGAEFHVSNLQLYLCGMMSPRGMNYVLYHDTSGQVVAYSSYRFTPPRWVLDGCLVLDDDTRIRIDMPGFVQWANGRPITDYYAFGSTEEDLRTEK